MANWSGNRTKARSCAPAGPGGQRRAKRGREAGLHMQVSIASAAGRAPLILGANAAAYRVRVGGSLTSEGWG